MCVFWSKGNQLKKIYTAKWQLAFYVKEKDILQNCMLGTCRRIRLTLFQKLGTGKEHEWTDVGNEGGGSESAGMVNRKKKGFWWI